MYIHNVEWYTIMFLLKGIELRSMHSHLTLDPLLTGYLANSGFTFLLSGVHLFFSLYLFKIS